MMKVLTQPVLKLRYFDCKKGAQHEGEVLNYVCIQKNCSQKGLICSVCKHDHAGHNVIPLKYLLGALKNHKENPMQSESFQAELQRLQELKNSFLYELKTVVQKLAQKVQKIEEQIIEIYKKRKVQLLNQIEINMKFNEIIDSTLNNNLGDQQSFQKDFKVIASLIESRDEKKQSNPLHSNTFSFSINLKKIISQYERNHESFSNKINKLLKETQSGFDSLLQVNAFSQSETISKPQSLLSESIEYRFNEKAKGTIIKITNNLKTAECTGSGNERFALIDGPVNKKGSWIRFKVEKLKNWVGFGLAIRNNIVSKKFQFLYNNLGHGSFLLSNNSYSWSHAFAANNIQNSNFSFVEGNIIKVQVNQNELIFTNESQQNKVGKLPILLNENEWKEACFCVNLCSLGDAATIM